MNHAYNLDYRYYHSSWVYSCFVTVMCRALAHCVLYAMQAI